MAERKTRDEVLGLVREGRARVDTALARMDDAGLTNPGIGGGEWSAKDLMGHLAYWEKAMIANLGGPAPEIGDQGRADATNEAVHAANVKRSLAEIRREFDEVHRDLVRRIEEVDDARLNSAPVPGKPELVWQYISGETWSHYAAHIEELEEWVARAG